jgi:hypothetical protein
MGTQATPPFAVSAFSPERVRLWATFARQASRGEEMSMVSWAFLAFWWELQMASSFERVVPNVEAGDIADAVDWLNLLVQEAGYALWQWREVLRQMASQDSLPVHYRQCLEDVQQQVARLSALLPQIGAYGLMLCSQYDLLIPPELQQAVMGAVAAPQAL